MHVSIRFLHHNRSVDTGQFGTTNRFARQDVAALFAFDPINPESEDTLCIPLYCQRKKRRAP